MENLNWVDYILLAILFLSILAGLKRGFVRELISVITWVAAVMVACMFSHQLASAFTSSQQVQSAVSSMSGSVGGVTAAQGVSMLSLGMSFLALFVGTMMVGSLINYFVSSIVDTMGIGIINRLLGAGFGLIRGLLTVTVVIFLVQLSPIASQNFWTSSQIVLQFQPAVAWLNNQVQPGLQTIKSQIQNVNPGQIINEGIQKVVQ